MGAHSFRNRDGYSVCRNYGGQGEATFSVTCSRARQWIQQVAKQTSERLITRIVPPAGGFKTTYNWY